MDSTTPSAPRSGISRRTVVAGAAWAAPVVAIAPAAQAATCSKICVTYAGTACKSPGNSDPLNRKAYKYLFTIENQTGGLPPYNGCMQVFFYSFTVNGTQAPDYMHVTRYNAQPVSSCPCASCITTATALTTLLNQIKALDPAFNLATAPDYDGSQNAPNPTPSFMCVADNDIQQVVVTGGEYQDSENGLNTVIKWAVIDPATCQVKYVEQAVIGATPPQCPDGMG